MTCVSEILKMVDPYDEAILSLLQERQAGFTTIQIAAELKRSRIDVKLSMSRLLQAKKVNKGTPFNYARWTLVDFDFTEQVISKRPGEAANKIKRLTEENERLREALKLNNLTIIAILNDAKIRESICLSDLNIEYMNIKAREATELLKGDSNE